VHVILFVLRMINVIHVILVTRDIVLLHMILKAYNLGVRGVQQERYML